MTNVAALIERYRLHHATPVMIRQVACEEGWQVLFRPLDSLHGFAVVAGDTRVMVINSHLPRPYQRMAIAHEMAHDLLGHDGSLHTARIRRGTFADWVWDRQEREATIAAARILIPLDRIEIGGEPAEVAVVCGVPVELVTSYATHVRSTMHY